MKNVRDAKQTSERLRNLRFELGSGGIERIRVGKQWFSRREADDLCEKLYSRKPDPVNPSSYLDFIRVTEKLGTEKDNYNKNRYVA